ncbi:hypothetical protein BDV34DRAFT_60044 [Aspergillus parasiticus]|uniref:Uncharacterized protein n=1 Tax=Aspergillus parasiticus TaxID=5067 RepID=A0A5N6DRP9_ASPPA|nr:hypothetical protein BDV34DRAFT_60044 [Aspergillus parasiticus]
MLFPCFFCLINILHTLNSLRHEIICKGASLQLRESLSIIGGIFLTPSSLFFSLFFSILFLQCLISTQSGENTKVLQSLRVRRVITKCRI